MPSLPCVVAFTVINLKTLGPLVHRRPPFYLVHPDPGQESPGGSTARTSFDSKGWLPSRLGEPMLRDPMWVYNNWPGGPPVPPGVPPITCMNIKTKGLQNGHLVSALILILETLPFLSSSWNTKKRLLGKHCL